MTAGWLSPALDDLLRSIREAAAYPGNAVDLVSYETERARRLALAGRPAAEAAAALARAGAAGAAAGLAGLRAADADVDGEVWLAEPRPEDGAPDRMRRMAVPPGERVLTLGEWVMGWSAAILARDALSALTLCSAEVLMPATEAQGQTGPVWAPHCGLLAAATLNRGSLPEWIDAARAAIDAPRAAPPEGAWEERLGPVLAIAEALVTRDTAGCAEAVEAAIAAHLAPLAGAEAAANPARAWPLEAAALLALMVDDGIVPGDAVGHIAAHLPEPAQALIRGDARPAPAVAEVSWPEAAILSADEGCWFFDLRGIPRDNRNHVLGMDADGRLVGDYVVSGALAPRGEVRFVLVETLEEAGATPMAVDAGELLALAEHYGAREETAGEALACVDAALARVPGGATAVPAASIRSPIGRAMLADEPGRFRADRMRAYRKGMAGAVADAADGPAEPEPAPVPGGAEDGDLAAFASVMEASVEMLKVAVRPILEELADAEEPGLAAELRPRPDELAEIFKPEAVAQAQAALARQPGPAPVDALHYSDIEIVAAPAGLLTGRNAVSEGFPAVYRRIADLLLPHRVWIAWRYVTGPAGDGVSCDGLVWTGERWVWLPEPWRLFEPDEAG